MELKGHTIGFKGEYSATVLKADGTVKEFLNEEKTLRSGDVIKNLLLDNFFQRLISLEDPLNVYSIRCGTGATPVNVTQSSLANQMSLTSGGWPAANSVGISSAVVDSGFIKGEITIPFTFGVGQIVGNISELGVNFAGTPTSSDTLVHSRALVVDNLGNPSTITVGSDEQLVITYTLRMEMPFSDLVTTVPMLVNGVPTDIEVTQRWGGLTNVRNYVSTLNSSNVTVFGSAVAFSAAGVSQSGSPSSTLGGTFTYNVGGSKRFTANASISQANFAGGVGILSRGAFKCSFNPPLPKTADRTLSITYSQTFGRLP